MVLALQWQLGTLPEWGAALGTMGAFLFAAFVYSKNLKTRRQTDREAQARLFDAWIASAQWQAHPPDDQDPTDGGPVEMRVDVLISNTSGQSMRGVDGSVFYGPTELSPLYTLGVIPPTSPGHLEERTLWFGPSFINPDERLAAGFLRGMLTMSISFADASGNRWFRTEKGELRFLYNLANRSHRQTEVQVDPTQAQ